MIPEMFPEDVLRIDLARTLGKVRRAKAFGDLVALLVQSGRAAGLNRQLRKLRKLRLRRDQIAA